MKPKFQANCLPTLIGSLPMEDHESALKLVMDYTPEIPLWVQLPMYREEGMMVQFLEGLPGVIRRFDKTFIDMDDTGVEADMLQFYEAYLAIEEGREDLENSRFSLTSASAKGFFTLMNKVGAFPSPPAAIKGQITGPITLGTGLHDQNEKAIFYNKQLRDMLVKHIAMKARWQVRELSKFKRPVILFFDEPALTGFGSSAFISISKSDVAACFDEVIAAVHAEGGLAGIHVCANAEWSILLESKVDIISFDAYAFFDRFLLYPELIKRFIEAGNILALGIVPTLNAEDVERETTGSLLTQLEDRISRLEKTIGINRKILLSQTLITPSCGTGSLSLDDAIKVLKMTKELSQKMRNKL